MNAERLASPVVSEFTRHGPEGSYLKLETIGNKPKVFFVSGIHGDEYEIIEPLRHVLDAKAQASPQYFGSQARALEAHPKAIIERNRTDDKHVDLNRQFMLKERPDHPQAKLLADSILEHGGVHTIFSFHEDVEEDRFYFYYHITRDDDGSMDPDIERLQKHLVSKVEAMGIPLYEGIDDIDLGFWVHNGFCPVAADAMHDNTFEMWSVQHEMHKHPNLKRTFLFEIPGKLSIGKKEALLQVIMDEFVEPYMEKTSLATQKNSA